MDVTSLAMVNTCLDSEDGLSAMKDRWIAKHASFIEKDDNLLVMDERRFPGGKYTDGR